MSGFPGLSEAKAAGPAFGPPKGGHYVLRSQWIKPGGQSAKPVVQFAEALAVPFMVIFSTVQVEQSPL